MHKYSFRELVENIIGYETTKSASNIHELQRLSEIIVNDLEASYCLLPTNLQKIICSDTDSTFVADLLQYIHLQTGKRAKFTDPLFGQGPRASEVTNIIGSRENELRYELLEAKYQNLECMFNEKCNSESLLRQRLSDLQSEQLRKMRNDYNNKSQVKTNEKMETPFNTSGTDNGVIDAMPSHLNTSVKEVLPDNADELEKSLLEQNRLTKCIEELRSELQAMTRKFTDCNNERTKFEIELGEARVKVENLILDASTKKTTEAEQVVRLEDQLSSTRDEMERLRTDYRSKIEHKDNELAKLQEIVTQTHQKQQQQKGNETKSLIVREGEVARGESGHRYGGEQQKMELGLNNLANCEIQEMIFDKLLNPLVRIITDNARPGWVLPDFSFLSNDQCNLGDLLENFISFVDNIFSQINSESDRFKNHIGDLETQRNAMKIKNDALQKNWEDKNTLSSEILELNRQLSVCQNNASKCHDEKQKLELKFNLLQTEIQSCKLENDELRSFKQFFVEIRRIVSTYTSDIETEDTDNRSMSFLIDIVQHLVQTNRDFLNGCLQIVEFRGTNSIIDSKLLGLITEYAEKSNFFKLRNVINKLNGSASEVFERISNIINTIMAQYPSDGGVNMISKEILILSEMLLFRQVDLERMSCISACFFKLINNLSTFNYNEADSIRILLVDHLRIDEPMLPENCNSNTSENEVSQSQPQHMGSNRCSESASLATFWRDQFEQCQFEKNSIPTKYERLLQAEREKYKKEKAKMIDDYKELIVSLEEKYKYESGVSANMINTLQKKLNECQNDQAQHDTKLSKILEYFNCQNITQLHRILELTQETQADFIGEHNMIQRPIENYLSRFGPFAVIVTKPLIDDVCRLSERIGSYLNELHRRLSGMERFQPEEPELGRMFKQTTLEIGEMHFKIRQELTDLTRKWQCVESRETNSSSMDIDIKQEATMQMYDTDMTADAATNELHPTTQSPMHMEESHGDNQNTVVDISGDAEMAVVEPERIHQTNGFLMPTAPDFRVVQHDIPSTSTSNLVIHQNIFKGPVNIVPSTRFDRPGHDTAVSNQDFCGVIGPSSEITDLLSDDESLNSENDTECGSVIFNESTDSNQPTQNVTQEHETTTTARKDIILDSDGNKSEKSNEQEQKVPTSIDDHDSDVPENGSSASIVGNVDTVGSCEFESHVCDSTAHVNVPEVGSNEHEHSHDISSFLNEENTRDGTENIQKSDILTDDEDDESDDVDEDSDGGDKYDERERDGNNEKNDEEDDDENDKDNGNAEPQKPVQNETQANESSQKYSEHQVENENQHEISAQTSDEANEIRIRIANPKTENINLQSRDFNVSTNGARSGQEENSSPQQQDRPRTRSQTKRKITDNDNDSEVDVSEESMKRGSMKSSRKQKQPRQIREANSSSTSTLDETNRNVNDGNIEGDFSTVPSPVNVSGLRKSTRLRISTQQADFIYYDPKKTSRKKKSLGDPKTPAQKLKPKGKKKIGTNIQERSADSASFGKHDDSCGHHGDGGSISGTSSSSCGVAAIVSESSSRTVEKYQGPLTTSGSKRRANEELEQTKRKITRNVDEQILAQRMDAENVDSLAQQNPIQVTSSDNSQNSSHIENLETSERSVRKSTRTRKSTQDPNFIYDF